MGKLISGVGNLLGLSDPGKPLQDFQPIGFSGAGGTATVGTGGVDFTRSEGLQGNLNQLSAGFTNQADQLGLLRGQVVPGLSRLTTEGVGALEEGRGLLGAQRENALSRLSNRRRSSIGNLRQNLARRRVAGSSFASDAEARTEAEFLQQQKEFENQFSQAENQFAQQIANTKQQSFLAEMEMNTQLINQESQARASSVNTFINQSNFESTIGANLAAGATSAFAANAQAQSNLASAQASGLGAGLGALAGLLIPGASAATVLTGATVGGNVA